MNSYYQTRWSLYDSFGLWVYSRYDGSYCFLPFGYGWSSPYGYFYPRDIWRYNLPPVIYNPPPPTTTTTTAPPTIASGSTITDKIRRTRANRESEPTRALPPFQRVQRDIGQFPTENQGDVFSSPRRIPSISSQESSAPVLISPSTRPPRKGDN